jgi:hypothetical protein
MSKVLGMGMIYDKFKVMYNVIDSMIRAIDDPNHRCITAENLTLEDCKLYYQLTNHELVEDIDQIDFTYMYQYNNEIYRFYGSRHIDNQYRHFDYYHRSTTGKDILFHTFIFDTNYITNYDGNVDTDKQNAAFIKLLFWMLKQCKLDSVESCIYYGFEKYCVFRTISVLSYNGNYLSLIKDLQKYNLGLYALGYNVNDTNIDNIVNEYETYDKFFNVDSRIENDFTVGGAFWNPFSRFHK